MRFPICGNSRTSPIPDNFYTNKLYNAIPDTYEQRNKSDSLHLCTTNFSDAFEQGQLWLTFCNGTIEEC